jgi:hypothetical protein
MRRRIDRAKAIEIYPHLEENVKKVLGDRVGEFDLSKLEVESRPGPNGREYVFVDVPFRDDAEPRR